MTTPTPVQLPLTREQMLERYDSQRYWGHSDGVGNLTRTDLAAFEAVLAAAGLPLAYAELAPAPPPEPRWPAKLVAVGGRCAARLRDPSAPGDAPSFAHVTVDGATTEEDNRAAELAHRWSRCPELEEEIVSRARQVESLLGTLAERTRERDVARAARDRAVSALAEWSDACARLQGERSQAEAEARVARRLAETRATEREQARRRVGQLDGQLVVVRAERDAALQEAADLRRRCAWCAAEMARKYDMRLVVSYQDLLKWSETLRGCRPVPGSEGGSGA